MIRTVLAIAIALGVTAAVAQEDPIKARKALMKTNGQQAKIVGDMAKGDTPFDAAAAHKAFASFQDAASKMPTLYPDSSKGGDPRTTSMPVPRFGKTWPISKPGSSSSARTQKPPTRA